jgi:hypothetical protein
MGEKGEQEDPGPGPVPAEHDPAVFDVVLCSLILLKFCLASIRCALRQVRHH